MIPDIGDVNTGNINVIPSANVGVGVVYTRPLNFRELRQVNLRDIPEKNIADNWDNPHHNNWLNAGGWKD